MYVWIGEKKRKKELDVLLQIVRGRKRTKTKKEGIMFEWYNKILAKIILVS